MAYREAPKPIEIPELPNSDAGWLKFATEFELRVRFDEHEFNDAIYTIARRSKNTWAVVHNGRFVLSKSSHDFIYESIPSERTEEFIQETRFVDLDDAFNHFLAYLDCHDVFPGGMSRRKSVQEKGDGR